MDGTTDSFSSTNNSNNSISGDISNNNNGFNNISNSSTYITQQMVSNQQLENSNLSNDINRIYFNQQEYYLFLFELSCIVKSSSITSNYILKNYSNSSRISNYLNILIQSNNNNKKNNNNNLDNH